MNTPSNTGVSSQKSVQLDIEPPFVCNNCPFQEHQWFNVAIGFFFSMGVLLLSGAKAARVTHDILEALAQ